jgi:hypothetical protein
MGACLLTAEFVARAHVLFARSARRSCSAAKIPRANYCLILVLGLVAAIISIQGSQAAVPGSECTREMELRSVHAADGIKDWQSLYKAFQAYAACDDGALAEGFSDRVEYLMTQRWRDVGKFAPLKTDKGFTKFVSRHVDELTTFDGMRQIVTNARKHCPSGYRAFCRSVLAAVPRP